jgi:uncharacterized membrane protein YgcG
MGLVFITDANFPEARYIRGSTQGESKTMKCPSCGAPFANPVPQCPACQVSLRQLDARFGAVPRHNRYLSDRSGQLPLREMKKLRDLLEIFEKKFPRSLFSVFVIDHIQDGSISEYIFWLFNRARFSSIETVERDNFDLLLGIDLESGQATLCIGYGLENYLTEDDLQAALAVAQDAFRAGDYPGGIRECVTFMMNRMREVARKHEDRTAAATATSANY